MSYELRVNILTSCVYCTSYESRVIFVAGVTSYFSHTSYELLFIAQVTSYFLHTSYELLFIAQVTSYYVLHELRVTSCIRVRVTACCTSYELPLAYKLRVTVFRVTSRNKELGAR